MKDILIFLGIVGILVALGFLLTKKFKSIKVDPKLPDVTEDEDDKIIDKRH